MTPETDHEKIRRLEHNIKVMRDSYLPARLEIASRMMAAAYADAASYDGCAFTALKAADALLQAYNDTTP